MTAVDTNILIYAHDRRDERKRLIAEGLIDSLEDGVRLWQVACEYLWETATAGWTVLNRARLLKGRGFSHWDSLLMAACLDAGVTTLYSEDFQAGTQVESLRIVNPFE